MATAMDTETTEATATWATQQAAAASTRNESKQRCWLERVSTSARVEEHETETHQCRHGHPSTTKNVRTYLSGVDGDAAGSRSSE